MSFVTSEALSMLYMCFINDDAHSNQLWGEVVVIHVGCFSLPH